MVEGCVVASVLEAAARVRVEGLREEAARLAEVLEAAVIELDRQVIAWQAPGECSMRAARRRRRARRP
jgi:hypothetical protein